MDVQIARSADDTGRPVLTLTGSIDLQTRDRLIEAGRAVLAEESVLVLDLAGVTFLDSTGIGALVELSGDAKEASGELVLRNPSSRVERVLELTGLTDVWATETGD